MSEKDIARLQRTRPELPLAPTLKRLHSLPVKFRIHFRICAITSRALKDNQPAYLANLVVRPKCSKYLRCTNGIMCQYVMPK